MDVIKKSVKKYINKRALSSVLGIARSFSLLLLRAFLQLSREFLNLHILNGQEVLQTMDLHLQELDRFMRLKDDLVLLC